MTEPRVTVPTPDPTAATLASSTKEVTCLREVLEARLDGMDRAIVLNEAGIEKMPAQWRADIENLEKLHEEKFSAVETQFTERDARTEKTAELNQKAIDAALSAAKESVQLQNTSNKEAIAKSEGAVDKRIDSIVTLMNSTSRAAEDKIQALKERLDRGEGKSSGAGALWIIIATAAALLISIGSAFLRR